MVEFGAFPPHKGLTEAGWAVDCPKASMYIRARIPVPYRALGPLELALELLDKAEVCVSPGIENEARVKQAVRGVPAMFKGDVGKGAWRGAS